MKKFISILNQHLGFTRHLATILALTTFLITGLLSLSATAQIPLKNIAKVETGHILTCALTTTGGVKCWGGNDTTIGHNTAVDIAGLTSGVNAVSIGMSHSCALTETGGVKCWGSNRYGQLGNNSTTQQPIPVDVVGLTSGVVAISGGYNHTCALTNTGEVKCWGQNLKGQLGDGTTVDRLTPVSVVRLGASATSVSAGHSHTCALTELNGLKCWGWNYSGQLGNNTRVDSLIPVDVYSLSTGVAKIDVGYIHSCALLTNGRIKCWGNNTDGRLGTNSTSASSPIPVDLAGTQPLFVDVAAGAYSSCGLTNIGSVKCWGANQSGQLGTGLTTRSLIPVTVTGLTSGASSLSFNYLNGCVVNNNGVLCWGNNVNGTIGDNTTQNRLTPTTVLQPFSPPITNVRAEDGQAIVIFTPPSDDSGYPATGYTVRPSGAGDDIYAGSTYSYTGPNELSHLVTGLVNGNSYTFTVVATNALGTGLPSPTSTTVVPMGNSTSTSSQISSSSQQNSSTYSSNISSAAVSATSSSVSFNSSIAGNSAISSSSISSSIFSSSSTVGSNNCDSVAIAFGATHTGSLASTDCRSGTRGTNYYVDRYSFSGEAGQQISIQLTSAIFDTYLVLKNASNTVITFNDDGGGGSNSRIPASSGTYTLPTTGNFIIEVTSYSSLKVGAYTLLVNTPAPISPCNPVLPISKWVDTYGALETTDCQTGARGSGYYTDSYYFFGKAGERIVIDYMTAFNSYVYLRNPAGTVIASNSGSGSLTNSRIPASDTLTLPLSGIYVIEATSYAEAKTAGYRLHLSSN
jgi:alpha-tubulin suppressor-like RCC1 family protein